LNQIKENVKNNIESMAAKWSLEERQECIDATAAAFEGGGAINSYLLGGVNPH
jgi:heme oxygenase